MVDINSLARKLNQRQQGQAANSLASEDVGDPAAMPQVVPQAQSGNATIEKLVMQQNDQRKARQDPQTRAEEGVFDSVRNFIFQPSASDPNIPELADPATDFPNLAVSGKVALVFATTTEPAALQQGMINVLPGAEPSADDKGNPTVTWRGKQYYLNRPGLSYADTFKLAADVAQYAPFGRVVGLGKSLLSRAALGAAVGGGVSVAQDVASDELFDTGQKVDAFKALASASGGAISEPIARGAASLLRLGARGIPVIRNLIGRREFFDGTGLTRQGRQAAQEAGIDPDQMSEALQRAFAENMARATRGFDANAAGIAGAKTASDEFGIPLTAGQRSGDLNRLAREEATRQGVAGGSAQRTVREFDEAQEQSILDAAQNIRTDLAGDAPAAGTQVEAMQTLAQRAADRAKALDERIGETYAAVATSPNQPRIAQNAINELPKRLTRRLRGENAIVDEELTPATLKTIKDLNSIARRKVVAQSLKQMEVQRRKIGARMDAANVDPTDKRGLAIIKKEFDAWFDDAISSGLKQGDPEVYALLKEARALRSEYGTKFGLTDSRDAGGKFVEKLIQNENADLLVRELVGSAQAFPKAMPQIIKRLKETLPADEFSQVRQLVWLNIVNKGADTSLSGARSFSPKKFTSGLKKAIGENSVVMREIFTSKEIGQMQRFGAQVERIIKPDTVGNPSRTAYELARMAREFSGSFLGGIVAGPAGALAGRGATAAADATLSRAAARRATSSVIPTRPPSGLFGLAPGIAAQTQGGLAQE